MISFKEKAEEDGLMNTGLRDEYKRIDGMVHFMEGYYKFKGQHLDVQQVKKEKGPTKKHFNEESTTMKNMNEFIASVMKNLFQPQAGEKFDFCDVLDLCCMPQFKFIQASTNPFIQNNRICYDPSSEKSWEGVIDDCYDFVVNEPLQQSVIDQILNQGGTPTAHQNLFSKAYLKGFDASQTVMHSEKSYNKYLEQTVSRMKPVQWNPIEDCCSIRVIDELPFSNKFVSQVLQPTSLSSGQKG